MRNIVLVTTACLALLFAIGCSSGSGTESVDASPSPTPDKQSGGQAAEWHESLDAALQAAKASNKLVFVDFSAEW